MKHSCVFCKHKVNCAAYHLSARETILPCRDYEEGEADAPSRYLIAHPLPKEVTQ